MKRKAAYRRYFSVCCLSFVIFLLLSFLFLYYPFLFQQLSFLLSVLFLLNGGELTYGRNDSVGGHMAKKMTGRQDKKVGEQ